MTADEATRRQELYDLLGELPPRSRPIGVERIGDEEREGYLLETLVLDSRRFTRTRAPRTPCGYHGMRPGIWRRRRCGPR